MDRKNIAIFFSFCLVVLISNAGIFAQSKTITLGGKEGWSSAALMDTITTGSGRFGQTSIELATNSRHVAGVTDLLLNFDDGNFSDAAGKYSVEANSLLHTSKSVMGSGGALSRGNGSGLALRGSEEAIFGKEGSTGSFLIEFWLCPAIAQNGEVIFEWHSSRFEGNNILFQKIESAFFNNRVGWTFTNVFNGYNSNHGEIELLSYSMIIPNKWARHELVYNEENGLLEYRINGKVEALKYITEDGREGRTIYQPLLGTVAPINICPAYTGWIDDVRISKSIGDSSDPSNLNYEHYSTKGGRFESKPIAVSPGATMQSISVIDTVPAQSAVRYYVRSGDNYLNWTDNYPEWVLAKDGESISNVRGRYFQVAAALFPDGRGSVTPSVTEIKIHYTEMPLPSAPFNLRASAGNGSVDLSWNYSVDENAGGYYIFYGNRPGEYLGSDAAEGASPIKVDNIRSLRLTGLENEKAYYFAISTYANFDDSVSGSLSPEVYARPGRLR